MNTYRVAFVGNPNVGKSAWINALSNADFTIGNWPGVTVERKEALCVWNQATYHLIDLPGCYSLQQAGNEETITASFLKQEHVDIIVNVVDATNLSRNLLLTLYLRELQIPMLLLFNFMDEAEKQHIQFDFEKLQRRLQIPILAYSAYDKEHTNDVKAAIIQEVEQPVFYFPLYTNDDIAVYVELFNQMERYMPASAALSQSQLHRLCMAVLQGEPAARQQLLIWHMPCSEVNTLCEQLTPDIIQHHRFDIVTSLMAYVSQDERSRYRLSRRIDGLLLHRLYGMPIFFVLFTLLLLFVFQVSTPWNNFIDVMIHSIVAKYVQFAIFWMPEVVQRLLLDGVLAGVGGVLVFVPLMMLLYMMLSLLEESGYMARIAFLLDRVMHSMHLSGKSFVALMLGFGCNVPAIYATRTLDDEKQKKLTALLIPFMSCGARLPVYVLFASAFFPQKAGLMIITIYATGIFFALLLAFFYSRFTAFKEERIFILELPPYRLPRISVVWHKVKLEVKGYVRKATGIVMWAMIILWSLSYFPNGHLHTSYIASFARSIAPIFEPLGFGTRWESVASLQGGIIAKETIIGFFDQINQQPVENSYQEINIQEDAKLIGSTFLQACKSSVLFLRPDVSLKAQSNLQVQNVQDLWKDDLAQLRAFCFMLYVLLSIPCIMTLQALYHEYGWKFTLLSVSSMLVIPYIVTFGVFQFFSLFS